MTGRGHKWTDEQTRRLRGLLDQGATLATCARALGVAHCTVARHVAEARALRDVAPGAPAGGADSSARRKPWTAADDEVLRAMCAGHSPRSAIAARLGRTQRSVSVRARALGLHAPVPGPFIHRRKRSPGLWTAEEDALLLRLHGPGISVTGMASRLHKSTYAVRQRMRALNCKPMRRGTPEASRINRHWGLGRFIQDGCTPFRWETCVY